MIVSLLGFGLGMMIRNTPAAVAVLILWPLVVENIVLAILSAAGVEQPAEVPAVHLRVSARQIPTAEFRSASAGGRRSLLRRGHRARGRDRRPCVTARRDA